MRKRTSNSLDAAAEMYQRTLNDANTENERKLIKDLEGVYINQNQKENILPKDVEYKRVNRWRLVFPRRLNIPPWFVKSVNRPSYPFDNEFTFEIYDGIYEPNGLLDYLKIKDKRGFNIKLELLDPTGVVVEKWVMKECFITAAYFGTLSYSDDSPVSIIVDVNYKKIKFKNIV